MSAMICGPNIGQGKAFDAREAFWKAQRAACKARFDAEAGRLWRLEPAQIGAALREYARANGRDAAGTLRNVIQARRKRAGLE
jgi:hypothetical protein